MRLFKDKELLIATSNKNKLKELKELLYPYVAQVRYLEDDIQAPSETGSSFKENAELKAKYYGNIYQLPTLADDSGFSVEELNGFPGVASARFASDQGGYEKAFQEIDKQLKEKSSANFKAYFTCAISLFWPDNHIQTFEGIIKGNLVFPPRGNLGFGYDPIFIPEGYQQTFAEVSKDVKNKISHRALALDQLIKHCFKNHE